MKKKVKKFGAGGDILTGVGAVLVGKALYDKYKEGKGKDDEESEYSRKVREFRDSKKAAVEPAPEPAKKEEDKPMSREEYLSKKAPPIKETGTFKGPDTAEPDLEYKSKPAVKKATPTAQPKKAEPAAPAKKTPPAKKVDIQTETEGSVPKDKSGYFPASKNVTSMIEGKGTEPPKKRGGIGPYHAFEGVTDYFSRLREGRKRPGEMNKGGAVKKYASGGSVSSASKRADGIAQRGKTKGRIC